MTTINVSNLIVTLQKKIDSSTNEQDILYYAKAIQQLKTSHVFVVAYTFNLPNPSEAQGSLYYVKQNETLYISTSFEWVEIYRSEVTYLFSWGEGLRGQLGVGSCIPVCSPVREISSATDWCQVSGGCCHTAAVKTSGELWMWGSNSSGELGDGTITNTCSPVREISLTTDWCQVSAGSFFTTAIKTSGELWAWGENICGQLGDGTAVNRRFPVREISSSTDWCQVSAGVSGALSTAAIKTSGELWVWGQGFCGALGDGTTVNKCSPVREFCSATDWCQVSVGSNNMSAIKTSGQLWSWGNGGLGRLGDGTTVNKCSPVREISSATDWCHVNTSGISAAIKTSGQLWSWGFNDFGGLGDGTTVNRCSPVRERSSSTDWCQLTTFGSFIASVKTSGQLWTWGNNACGQLGDGTTVNRCSPVREISSSTDWCQVSAGNSHVAAISIRNLS